MSDCCRLLAIWLTYLLLPCTNAQPPWSGWSAGQWGSWSEQPRQTIAPGPVESSTLPGHIGTLPGGFPLGPGYPAPVYPNGNPWHGWDLQLSNGAGWLKPTDTNWGLVWGQGGQKSNGLPTNYCGNQNPNGKKVYIPQTTATPSKIIIGCFDTRNQPQYNRGFSKLCCEDLMTWALYIAGDKANCQQSSGRYPNTKRRRRENDGWGPQRQTTTESYDNYATTTTNNWGRPQRPFTYGSYYAAKGVIFGGSALDNGENIPSPTGTVQRSYTGASSNGSFSPGVGFCSSDGKMINSIYLEFERGDDLVIATNGIPVHDYELNSRQICEQYKVMIIPRVSKTPPPDVFYSVDGPIGISRSGGFIFSSTEANCQLMTDTCGGLISKSCAYSYAQMPSERCFSAYRNCTFVGHLKDGYPIYSHCRSAQSCYERLNSRCDKPQFNGDGKSRGDCSMDEANGVVSDGRYSHYFSQRFPFAPPKLSGAALHQWCDVSF